MGLRDSQKRVDVTNAQMRRVEAAVKKIEALPLAAPALPPRPQGPIPDVNVIAHGNLTSDLDGSTATMQVQRYDGGEADVDGEILTVRSLNGSYLLPEGTSVWAYWSRGAWYAIPQSGDFHGVLEDDLVSGGTANVTLYVIGDASDISVPCNAWAIPEGKKLASGQEVFFFLDGADNNYYVNGSENCLVDS